MTAGEGRFATVFFLVCAASAAAIALSLGFEKIRDARNRIRDYEERVRRLSAVSIDEAGARARLQRIEKLVATAEDRISAASRTPMSAFGHEVVGLLGANGIAPEKYQLVSGTKGEELELSLSCDVEDLLRFMRAATEKEGWTIPYASMHLGRAYGRTETVLRLAQ
jgi:hypothetical protein